MKHLYLAITFCFGAFGLAHAQQETTLSTMRSLPQATYTNPAAVPAQPFYLGLPGISSISVFSSSNSISYNKLDQAVLSDTSITTENLLALKPFFKEKTNFYAGMQVDLLSLGIKINPYLYLRYRSSMQLRQRTIMPASLLLLADEAFQNNPTAITVDPSLQGMAYLEHSFGASYVINRKLTLGANFKKLNGIAGIQTKTLDVKITPIPNEDLIRLQSEAQIFISGQDIIKGGLGNVDQQTVTNKLSTNGGWAIDLGATYQLNDKLQLGLSVLDLGAIKWSEDAREYSAAKASFTVGRLKNKNEDPEGVTYDALMDSVSKYIVADEKKIAGYRTALPTRTYLSASYSLHRSIQASGIFFTETYEGKFLPGFTAALHKDFGRRIGSSISYTAINGSYNNIGAGLSFRLTPFQFYVVTDNLLGAFNFKDAQMFNARLGMNLMFGTIKKPSKLPY